MGLVELLMFASTTVHEGAAGGVSGGGLRQLI